MGREMSGGRKAKLSELLFAYESEEAKFEKLYEKASTPHENGRHEGLQGFYSSKFYKDYTEITRELSNRIYKIPDKMFIRGRDVIQLNDEYDSIVIVKDVISLEEADDTY